jgi:hypothetical protein
MATIFEKSLNQPDLFAFYSVSLRFRRIAALDETVDYL